VGRSVPASLARIPFGLLPAAAVVFLCSGCSLPPGTSGSGEDTVEIVSHEVSEGETIASIADDYYGDRAADQYLADKNDVSPDYELEPGSVLNVPVGSSDVERYRRRTEAKILYNRGTLLAERGDLQKAEEEFRAALTADPTFFDAGYNLGVVLLMSGEAARAVAALERTVSLRPKDPTALFALGRAYFEEERTEQAIVAFDRALDVDPGNEDAHYARAVALLKVGRREEGIISLDAYVRRYPDGVWVDQARARLEELAREVADE
jgi:tetratricopeptide (TPR) repeat protein